MKNSCPDNTFGLCNPDCYNMWSHMLRWLERTPEFELSVVFIASPLTLVVALWGMTSTTVRGQLHHTVRFCNIMLRCSG